MAHSQFAAVRIVLFAPVSTSSVTGVPSIHEERRSRYGGFFPAGAKRRS
jgi:hypothetical protein